MRDGEFTDIYKKLVPQLDKFFHVCLKSKGYSGDYKGIKRDLISLTGHDAFLNSRKESLSGYSIESLIWIKAHNIWSSFINPKGNKLQEVEQLEAEQDDKPDALYRILVDEQLKLIKQRVGPEAWRIIELKADGLPYKEIAQTLDKEEGKIKMQMHRLRKRLEKESLRFL